MLHIETALSCVRFIVRLYEGQEQQQRNCEEEGRNCLPRTCSVSSVNELKLNRTLKRDIKSPGLQAAEGGNDLFYLYTTKDF